MEQENDRAGQDVHGGDGVGVDTDVVTAWAPPEAGMIPIGTADSAEVVIAKRLLDHAKRGGFTFQRAAPGVDGPLVGHRVGDGWVDLIHIEGFSHDCFAWRKRTSPLIVTADALVQRRVQGSALDVLHEVLAWEPQP